ncbi:MAG: sorbitol dehydrogenase [Symploca sp. SIO1C2]|nr:sorbitol dehydrogenase [Symploca sp. SIO1C2]
MTDNNSLETFVDLSAALTGFPPKTIAPLLDPTNLKQLYFDKMNAEMSDELNEMSNIYKQIVGSQSLNPDLAQQVANEILNNPNLCNAAQALLRLWYLGSWSQTSGDEPSIVSQEAYTNSLVWRTIQAHPMGYSTFHYGHWGEQPPSLENFVGTW